MPCVLLWESTRDFSCSTLVSVKRRFGGFAALCVHHILPFWVTVDNIPTSTEVPFCKHRLTASQLRSCRLFVRKGPAAWTYTTVARQGLERWRSLILHKHFHRPR